MLKASESRPNFFFPCIFNGGFQLSIDKDENERRRRLDKIQLHNEMLIWDMWKYFLFRHVGLLFASWTYAGLYVSILFL